MKKKRIENKELLEAMRKVPCCACLKNPPSDPHHIKTVKSGGPDETWNLVSLCRPCHQSVHKIGLKSFVNIFKNLKAVIIKKGWVFCETRNKWVYDRDN